MTISTFITEDDERHLSICYDNLYLKNGIWEYLTFDKNINPPCVGRWTYGRDWKPNIKFFDSEESLNNYVNSFTNVVDINLGVLFSALWTHNIAHGIFDGLYPIYLALVKFNYINDPFTMFTDYWNGEYTNKSHNVFETFSDNKIVHYDKDMKQIYRVKKLICGTGYCGNIVKNKKLLLYGEKYDGMKHFKTRMISRYGINMDLPINDKIRIAFIQNKRYDQYEMNNINKVIEIFNNDFFSCEYINWGDYKDFREQLKIQENIDIEITGPGTGMLNSPFMKRGAVVINLGELEYCWGGDYRKTYPNTDHNKICNPGYIDQNVLAACDWLNVLFYNRYSYKKIEIAPLIELICEAIKLVTRKQINANKHYIDSKIFMEYCTRIENADKLCEELTGHGILIERFINENPFVLEKVKINIKLLNEIKTKYNFDTRYELTRILGLKK